MPATVPQLPDCFSASILSCNLACLGEEIHAVIDAGADRIHFDVMYNHYVPNLSFGPAVFEALKPYALKVSGSPVAIEVHLMVQPVDTIAETFVRSGASLVSFHIDASPHVANSLKLIRALGAQTGLVFSPDEPLGQLSAVLDLVDLVLIMGVTPGFGAQEFIESTLPKLAQVRRLLDSSGRSIRLAVDGGVKIENIRRIADAGADTFVIGSAIFETSDYKASIDAFRHALEK